ncbi:hypothetical protein ACFO25_07920 [Paenactinomyces guangxiensis]|uniref:Uncharacterized protein n=1 Tax=Paenactinomyces guangxiensis TaxID=1490290 RepID=A0A7W1WNA6_9BACL|nr:hypothetical protein [Paenactinomyces guangxiensis]MBA4493029.1 hypothetical protein [Paenactinomyces guangxiensis]MBH8590122.1 hypothetical protein [Paenactinomyces guangxiensis]
MKEQEIIAKLKEMRVGEPIRFTTENPDVYLDVDRIFLGLDEGWVIYHQERRLVMHDLQEAVQYICKYWNLNIKKVMDLQFSELDEIEDLGEY